MKSVTCLLYIFCYCDFFVFILRAWKVLLRDATPSSKHYTFLMNGLKGSAYKIRGQTPLLNGMCWCMKVTVSHLNSKCVALLNFLQSCYADMLRKRQILILTLHKLFQVTMIVYQVLNFLYCNFVIFIDMVRCIIKLNVIALINLRFVINCRLINANGKIVKTLVSLEGLPVL